MNSVFADTGFYLAILNPADQYHVRATQATQSIRGPIVTTQFILIELANAMSDPRQRGRCASFVAHLRQDRSMSIVPAINELCVQGWDLYTRRLDKCWSLSDCISFIVMQELGIFDALANDQDFEQAGFRRLLI